MYKIVFALIISALFALSCSDEPTNPQGAVNPVITSLRIQSQWNLNATDSNLVEIAVTDPQGFNDLKSIAVKVFDDANQQVFMDSLYDDGGLNGSNDLLAGDGVFRNLFLPSAITSTTGVFTFNFNVQDRAGHNAEEFKKDISFGFNEAPEIQEIINPSQLLSGAETEFIFVNVSDLDGTNKNTKVFFDLLQNDQSVFAQPISMGNDGNVSENGDVFANDSIFSFKMDSSFAAGKIGDYKMKFVAEDEFGDKSLELIKDLFIENKTGNILSVSVPDSIALPAQGFTTALVTAKVNDPQGLMDVDSVYFNSIKPDGSPANGNPFSMVDNGLPFNIDGNPLIEAGDKVEGDGIYSLSVFVFNNNLPGTYQFTFYMRDKVGNLTAAIVDSIEVK